MAAQQQQHRPEVALLPPGRHIVRPAIYKASSVVSGINQLGQQAAAELPLRQQQVQAPMMQQFFDTRPRADPLAGHESPRSTKSAMAPASALKLASKRLAKQQQQLLHGHSASHVKPLLATSGPHATAQQVAGEHHSSPADYWGAASATHSANQSPGSVQVGRLARQRSKSTGENLHLLHQQQLSADKMLLATAAPVLSGCPTPPPDYIASNQPAPLPPKQRLLDGRQFEQRPGDKLSPAASNWRAAQLEGANRKCAPVS